MPCINKPLTTAQFLAAITDVAIHRMERTHQRHARAVVRLTNAAAELLAFARTIQGSEQSPAVAEVEAALAAIREAV